ncbi:MAG: PEP-CTERM sorting domain-containing protein [Okeania sp. SIO2H7]|nr:PEP-CTERM sorting domain-containing protein [Okeania sp. SIO2H7]
MSLIFDDRQQILTSTEIFSNLVYSVGTNPRNHHQYFGSFGDRTTGDGSMMIVNGAPPSLGGGPLVWAQTIDVTPNTNYNLSAWVASTIERSPARLQFAIDSQAVGSILTASLTNHGLWENLTGSWNSGAKESINLSIINHNLAWGGNDFALYDISMIPVEQTPEPVPDSKPILDSFLIENKIEDIFIDEAESVLATLLATDPNEDFLNFSINGENVANASTSEGKNFVSQTVTLGPYSDDGIYQEIAKVTDKTGLSSETVTRTVNVQNVAPTLDFNFSNAVINEGESAIAELSATDPGADSISFFLNDELIGTDTRTSGNRFAKKNLGVFADEGTFTYTGKAEDDDGGISNVLTKTLTVKNLDPTITSLTEDFTIRTNTKFNFAATATDPGINDILTFDWDLDGDGLFDDFTGSSGEWSFSDPGLYAMNLRVSDGDGGFAFASVEAKAVPEPGSVLGLLTLGALGLGSRLRKRR